MITVDELISATLRRDITWSQDPDPVATVHGRIVFVGAHQVYIRTSKGWDTLGPAHDLRRTITTVQEGQ